MTLNIAIVGAGPAGYYAAEAALKKIQAGRRQAEEVEALRKEGSLEHTLGALFLVSALVATCLRSCHLVIGGTAHGSRRRHSPSAPTQCCQT